VPEQHEQKEGYSFLIPPDGELKILTAAFLYMLYILFSKSLAYQQSSFEAGKACDFDKT
jgi:hypothetical protein